MLSVSPNKPVLSLSEMTMQPEKIKILIIHTPLALNIDSLYLFKNIVKLDLSNNNLASFPHIGFFEKLKFLFLHQNKLTIKSFIGIFQKQRKKSVLSCGIVWITFWSNKDHFLARHYASNETSAVVFDHNLIVPEEKSPIINLSSDKFNIFSPQSDISDILTKETRYVKNRQQEELVQDFWESLRQIRKRQLTINPIIKIQSLWRGWGVREKIYQLCRADKQQAQLKTNCFGEWKKITRRQIKLRSFLKMIKIDIKSRKIPINKRLIELARQAKARVLHRKQKLKNEIKFFLILKVNFALLQDFYNNLQITTSKAIYILHSDLALFKKFVIPYAHLFSHEIEINENQKYKLIVQYNIRYSGSKELIKLIQLNKMSLSQKIKKSKSLYKGQGTLFHKISKSKVKVHFNRQEIQKMNDISEKLEKNQRKSIDQLVVIEGNPQKLKDISRGIYFFNTRRITSSEITNERINFFSESSLQQISAAVLIQKAWKGYIFRKKYNNLFKQKIIMIRSVIKIQKWFKQLSFQRRNNFKKNIGKKLKLFTSKTLLIEFTEYYNFITQKQKKCSVSDCLKIYKNLMSDKLVLFWNTQSQKQQLLDRINFKMKSFDSQFLGSSLKFNDNQIKLLFPGEIDEYYEKCDLGFLFHFGTQSKIIQKDDKKYLKISYSTETDRNFHLFLMFLFSYSWKTHKTLNVMNQQMIKTKKIELKNQNELLFVSYMNEGKNYFLTKQIKQSNSSTFFNKCKFFVYESTKVKKIEGDLSCVIIHPRDQLLEQKDLISGTEKLKTLLFPRKKKRDIYQIFQSYRGQKIYIRKKSLKRVAKLNNKSCSSQNFTLTNDQTDYNINNKHKEQVISHSLLEKTALSQKQYSISERKKLSSVRKLKSEPKSEEERERKDYSSIKKSLPISLQLNLRKKSIQRVESERENQDRAMYLQFLPKTKSFLEKGELFNSQKRQKRYKQPKNRYLPPYQGNNENLEKHLEKVEK